jgi:hypothetical protein
MLKYKFGNFVQIEDLMTNKVNYCKVTAFKVNHTEAANPELTILKSSDLIRNQFVEMKKFNIIKRIRMVKGIRMVKRN